MVSPALERKPGGRWANVLLIREIRPSTVLPGLTDVLKEVPGDTRRALRQLIALRVEATLEEPPGWLLAFLRRFRPVVRYRRLVLVTRTDDVRNVLSNEQAFTVRPYNRTMQHYAGPFVLGLDGDEHAKVRRKLELVLAPIDLSELRTWATDTAEQLLTEHSHGGRLDVVTGLAERLPARFCRDYFGVPGPDEQTLVKWSKTLFEGTFLNIGGDRSLEVDADLMAAEMRTYTDEVVSFARERGRSSATSTTVLDRLIAADSDNTAVRTTLIGLVLATIPPVAKATARATDQLLGSARASAGARSAAQQGDDELLWQYIREALRFRPQSSALLREAVGRSTLANGTRYHMQVDAHALVLAATASAMRDPRVVSRPRRFRTDRPDSAYLHFGVGPHRCLGERLAPVVLTAAIGTLFRRQGLRRVPGPAGRLVTEGRWPAHLTVTL